MSGLPPDLVVIGPFIAAVALALAVLVVDLVWPGRRTPVVVVTLVGLALLAGLTIATGWDVAAGDGTLRATALRRARASARPRCTA